MVVVFYPRNIFYMVSDEKKQQENKITQKKTEMKSYIITFLHYFLNQTMTKTVLLSISSNME